MCEKVKGGETEVKLEQGERSGGNSKSVGEGEIERRFETCCMRGLGELLI